MATYEVPNLTGGADEIMLEVATAVPSFVIGLLIFVWGFVFIGGLSSQNFRRGFSDAPLWSVMASLSTMLIALLLSIKPGFMTAEVLGIVVTVTLFSGLWLFLSKGRTER